MGCPVCMVFSPSASARGTGLFYLTVQFVPFSLGARGTSFLFSCADLAIFIPPSYAWNELLFYWL